MTDFPLSFTLGVDVQEIHVPDLCMCSVSRREAWPKTPVSLVTAIFAYLRADGEV